MTSGIIDCDAHIAESGLLERIDEPWRSLIGFREYQGDHYVEIEGRLYPRPDGPGCGVPIRTASNPAALEGVTDTRARLRDMDREGIEIQVCYGGLSIGVTGYNEWAAELCGAAPARLKAIAVVPLQDPPAAVKELERAKRLGLAGVMIPPALRDHNLDHPSLDEFYDAAQALDLPLGIHGAPGMHLPSPTAERFSSYVPVHCLSFPTEQMAAMTALVFGGVCEKFEKLRVAFLESGVGWVPYYLERLGEHFEKRPSEVPLCRREPIEYVRRGQLWFSFEPEERGLAHAVAELGEDAIMYASDYPHWDSDFPDTSKAVSSRRELGDAVKRKLLRENAARFYGL
jgi:hypothetical protein